ncbi:Protein LURP-one-related 15 [Linum perenne]
MLDKDATVTDFNGTVIFRMKSKSLSLNNSRKLMDASGNVLASMSQKVWATLHSRWEIFHGDNDDLLFSVKMSSMRNLETKDVFLATNTKEKVPDFTIKGCYEESSCIIYLGNTNHIVARMYRDHHTKTKSFKITIYPNVDYAFIVCLAAVIIKEMKQYWKAKKYNEIVGKVSNMVSSSSSA